MEGLVKILADAGPYTILALAVLGVVYIFGRLVLRHSTPKPLPPISPQPQQTPPEGAYVGPERRQAMLDLDREMERIRQGMESNREAIQTVHGRLDRIEANQRQNDTQTAREIGELTGAVQYLTQVVVRNNGLRSTPPEGNAIPEPESQKNDPPKVR